MGTDALNATYRSGERINDRYEVVRPLGTGAMGQVFLVRDLERKGQQLALKYVFSAQRAATIQRFKTEFATLAHLRHPNISAVYDFAQDTQTGGHFFTCEFIEGQDFDKAARQMSIGDIIEVFVQALRALAYLHGHGIMHFDIKSANMLISLEEGAKPRCTLIDFGVASREFHGKRKGTPSYMAPEVVATETADARADLYSLGVLLYYALTKTNPFRAKNRDITYKRQRELMPPPPSHANASIPDYLDRIVMQMLAKLPQSRFMSATDVIRALNTSGPRHFDIETDLTRQSYVPDAGPFIGRRTLREHMKACCTQGYRGPAMTWVSGRAGTGKSRTLHEWKLRAQIAGHMTLHYDLANPDDRRACLEHMLPLSQHTAQDYTIVLDNIDHLLSTPGAQPLLEQIRAACHDGVHRQTLPDANHAQLHIVWSCADDSQVASSLCLQLGIRIESTQFLTLRNFSLAELTQYLQVCTGMDTPPAQICQAIHAFTDGNPFFVTAVIQSLIRDGQLLDAHGRWRASTIEDLGVNLEALALPRTIEAAAAHDFATMSAATQSLAAVLAVHRRPISLTDLQSIHDKTVNADALASLIRRGYIQFDAHDQQYRYRSHAQIQAIYTVLGRREREQWHDRIAAHYAQLDEASDMTLEHRAAGSDVAAAQRARWELAQRLHSGRQSAGAIPLLEQYLQSVADAPICAQSPMLVEVYWLLGRCHHEIRDYTRATEYFAHGQRCLNSDSDADVTWHIRLLEAWGFAARDARDYATAEIKFGEALALLDPSDDNVVLRIRIQNAIAQAILYRGNDAQALDRARLIFERTAKATQSLPLQEHRDITNNDLGHTLFQQGQYKSAIPVLQSDVMFFAHTGRPRAQSRSRGLLAEAYRHCGEFERARTECFKAIQLAKDCQDASLLVHHYTNMGNVCTDQQQHEDAIGYYQRALDLSRRVGDPSSAMALLLNLGILCRSATRYTEAESHFHSVINFARNGHLTKGLDERYHCRALLELAHLLHLQERYDDAYTYIRDARALADQSAACKTLLFWIVATTIEIHRDQGKLEQAKRLVPTLHDHIISDVQTQTADTLKASLH